MATFALYADEFSKRMLLRITSGRKGEAKACILKHHLLPAFGGASLDTIANEIEILHVVPRI